jgi:hypothetical protein
LSVGYFWDRVLWTICSSWLPTLLLLISASWVARITGLSHWLSAWLWFEWRYPFQTSCWNWFPIVVVLGGWLNLPKGVCTLIKGLEVKGIVFLHFSI